MFQEQGDFIAGPGLENESIFVARRADLPLGPLRESISARVTVAPSPAKAIAMALPIPRPCAAPNAPNAPNGSLPPLGVALQGGRRCRCMFSLNVVISGPAESPSRLLPGPTFKDYLRFHRAAQVQALAHTAGCGKEMVHGGQIQISASLMLATIGNPV